VLELESLLAPLSAAFEPPPSPPSPDPDPDPDDEEEDDPDPERPFADADDARESVMYQPLPLNTMPTGWMTFRSAPPHCSHVVSGGSEKLWRFSIMSLQEVQV
jgi:hypothetical protein